MHKPKFIFDNEIHIIFDNDINLIFWDFEIETDQQFPTRRPDLELICKKKRFVYSVHFAQCA